MAERKRSLFDPFYPGEDLGLIDPTWPGVTERGIRTTAGLPTHPTYGGALRDWYDPVKGWEDWVRSGQHKRSLEAGGRMPPPARDALNRGNYSSLLDAASDEFYVDTGLRPERMVGPMAGVTKLYSAPFRSSKVRNLLKQPTSYNREDIRQLAEEVISPGGLTGISDTIIHTKKILNLRADGTLSPLMHERNRRFREGVWEPFTATLKHPTKVDKRGKPRSSANLAFRPAFYGGPLTPQLKMGWSSNQYRVKRDVAFRNWTKIKRPENQGGGWYMAAEMLIIPRKSGSLAQELAARLKAMRKK